MSEASIIVAVANIVTRGGKLILYEGINPDVLRTGFIFGVLPGWWLSRTFFNNSDTNTNLYQAQKIFGDGDP